MAPIKGPTHSERDIVNIVAGAHALAWEIATQGAAAGPIAAALIMLALRDTPANEIGSILRKKAKPE